MSYLIGAWLEIVVVCCVVVWRAGKHAPTIETNEDWGK